MRQRLDGGFLGIQGRLRGPRGCVGRWGWRLWRGVVVVGGGLLWGCLGRRCRRRCRSRSSRFAGFDVGCGVGILVGRSCIGLLRLLRLLLVRRQRCWGIVGDGCRSGDGVVVVGRRGGVEVVVGVWGCLLVQRSCWRGSRDLRDWDRWGRWGRACLDVAARRMWGLCVGR